MTVYCIGSANLGAVVGQTHAVTTRGVFGTLGSALVSLLLVIDGMGFYLFTVLFVITPWVRRCSGPSRRWRW